jgi:hypothetical protein
MSPVLPRVTKLRLSQVAAAEDHMRVQGKIDNEGHATRRSNGKRDKKGDKWEHIMWIEWEILAASIRSLKIYRLPLFGVIVTFYFDKEVVIKLNKPHPLSLFIRNSEWLKDICTTSAKFPVGMIYVNAPREISRRSCFWGNAPTWHYDWAT